MENLENVKEDNKNKWGSIVGKGGGGNIKTRQYKTTKLRINELAN